MYGLLPVLVSHMIDRSSRRPGRTRWVGLKAQERLPSAQHMGDKSPVTEPPALCRGIRQRNQLRCVFDLDLWGLAAQRGRSVGRLPAGGGQTRIMNAAPAGSLHGRTSAPPVRGAVTCMAGAWRSLCTNLAHGGSPPGLLCGSRLAFDARLVMRWPGPLGGVVYSGGCAPATMQGAWGRRRRRAAAQPARAWCGGAVGGGRGKQLGCAHGRFLLRKRQALIRDPCACKWPTAGRVKVGRWVHAWRASVLVVASFLARMGGSWLACLPGAGAFILA